jgi:hypothetical protein
MRYAKSIRQLVSAGSRNLIDTQLRKRLEPIARVRYPGEEKMQLI